MNEKKARKNCIPYCLSHISLDFGEIEITKNHDKVKQKHVYCQAKARLNPEIKERETILLW